MAYSTRFDVVGPKPIPGRHLRAVMSLHKKRRKRDLFYGEPVECDSELLQTELAAGSIPHGFIFDLIYSSEAALKYSSIQRATSKVSPRRARSAICSSNEMGQLHWTRPIWGSGTGRVSALRRLRRSR